MWGLNHSMRETSLCLYLMEIEIKLKADIHYFLHQKVIPIYEPNIMWDTSKEKTVGMKAL